MQRRAAYAQGKASLCRLERCVEVVEEGTSCGGGLVALMKCYWCDRQRQATGRAMRMMLKLMVVVRRQEGRRTARSISVRLVDSLRPLARARASRLLERPASRASFSAVSSSHSSQCRKCSMPAKQTSKEAMKSLHLHESGESRPERRTATDDGRLVAAAAAISRPRVRIAATKR